MEFNSVFHLSKPDIIKEGSIYTPDFLVELVKRKVSKFINKNTSIIDFGAGYGAFTSSFLKTEAKEVIATENDQYAFDVLKKNCPNAKLIFENSLINLYKNKYSSDHTNLVIIGNPPYNDLTSQYKKGEKGFTEVDPPLKSRDLGISFLNLYAFLQPKAIGVLHPLSYLMKKANFRSIKLLREHYKLIDATIFPNTDFVTLSKNKVTFPIIAAIYIPSAEGMSFDYIQEFPFSILGSSRIFKISDYTTIDGIVKKYPNKKQVKSKNPLEFYTLRDINALKRNKTFFIGDIKNGIQIDKGDLFKYAWLDAFKHYFNAGNYNYLFGNLSPYITKKLFTPSFKIDLIKYILSTNDSVKEYDKLTNNSISNFFSIRDLNYDKNEIENEINAPVSSFTGALTTKNSIV